MDWLILILGVPAVLVPLVLLFGFAGCGQNASFCTEDGDCPQGTICDGDGRCVSEGEPFEPDDPDEPPPPPPVSPPQDLNATAIDDQSVRLTWTSNEAGATFKIERALDDDLNFQEIVPSGPVSPADTTDDTPGLLEGVTFLYRVSAVVDGQTSLASDSSSATVLPATPTGLTATAAGNNQIIVTWTNASTVATEFRLQERIAGTFTDIPLPVPTSNSFQHNNLGAGTTHEYRVFATVDGFEDSNQQRVDSLPSASQSATTTAVFTTAFAPPPTTLTTDETRLEGFCVVQRLRAALLTPNLIGTQVRITLRGSTAANLILDNVAISQVGTTGDPYDAAPDLKLVATAVTIPANTSVTLPPVNYTFDSTQDLLVAFDFNSTSGGNPRFGALTGADSFGNGPPAGPVTAEALVQNRTTGYSDLRANNLYLIETIEVL
jgi:hypothetical protein